MNTEGSAPGRWTSDDYWRAANQATDVRTRRTLAREAERIERRERGEGSGW